MRLWSGRGRFPALNVALFVATCATTLAAGGLPEALSRARGPGLSVPDLALAAARAGWPFAASLIGILLAHEMGHYVLARRHRVDATLPYFIPVPVGPVGTLGAVIRIRSPLPSRLAVLDVGAAGPFAGAVVALPLLAWGLLHSEVRPLPEAIAPLAPSGLFHVVRDWLAGAGPAGAASGAVVVEQFGDSLLTWGVQRLVLGPLPPGHDVFIHPVAFAAWLGLFVTTLNLIPLGQLDGGHVVYALLGPRRALLVSRLVSHALLAAGLFLSWNWLVWWAVTRFGLRLHHPRVEDDQPLDRGRAALAWLALALFAGTFIPVPFSL